MPRRSFEPVPVQHGDRRVRGMRAVCSKCGFEGKVPVSIHGQASIKGEAESISATKKFTTLGWEIGATPSRDLCPSCAAKPKPEKPALILVQTNGAPMSQDSAAAAPREMTPADRRVIFVKLEDVYSVDNKGYTGIWTDKLVAEDLGVPRAWVTDVREQFFGPEGGNEAIRIQLAEARAVLVEAQALIDEFAGLKKRMDAMQSDVARLSTAITPLTNHAHKIEGTIISLEKTVR